MKNLKLNKMADSQLSEKEMSQISGGQSDPWDNFCTCGCRYANKGGSSVSANGGANSNGNLRSQSKDGCVQVWVGGYVFSDWDCPSSGGFVGN